MPPVKYCRTVSFTENIAGIEVGKTQLTFGLDLWARMANVNAGSTGKTVVQFDSNAGTGNIVEMAESQDPSSRLIYDVFNGITITSTSSAKAYGPYVQPMGGLTAYIQSPLTVTQASTFSGGVTVSGGETISTGSLAVSSSTGDIALGSSGTHITGASVCRTTRNVHVQQLLHIIPYRYTEHGSRSLTTVTSNSASFTRSFASGSRCALTPTTDPSTACGAYWVTSNTSAVTAHVHSACSIVFVYHCYGF